MRSDADVRRVFELAADGLTKSAIARATGVSRSRIRAWLACGEEAVLASPMRAASKALHLANECQLVTSVERQPYAYLLGQYLGDGCVSSMGRGRWRLRITTCDDYPGIRGETVDAVRLVVPGHAVGLMQREGCTDVSSYSNHWPCLLPQSGPGVKHKRPIVLAHWQQQIAIQEYPGEFIRGLVHSDGCRAINRVRRRLPSGDRWYEYGRYLFVNRSDDIRELFRDACGMLGVEVRPNNRWSLSVARRASVEILDTVVGPKY